MLIRLVDYDINYVCVLTFLSHLIRNSGISRMVPRYHVHCSGISIIRAYTKNDVPKQKNNSEVKQ